LVKVKSIWIHLQEYFQENYYSVVFETTSDINCSY